MKPKYTICLLLAAISLLSVTSCEKEEDQECALPEGMEFISIPGGTFLMGSERGRERTKEHEVSIAPFEMMTTEVTQSMWEEVMGENYEDYPQFTTGRGYESVGNDFPICFVTWKNCQDFADSMNVIDPLYFYRLPSEAEWEYACRAGSTTLFYWGDDSDLARISDYAWYDGNSDGDAQPVAGLLPNEWGLYDMSGNLMEWCEDLYTSNYDDCYSDGRPFNAYGAYRVVRGGSYRFGPEFCMSYYRHALEPEYYSEAIGFRLVRVSNE